MMEYTREQLLAGLSVEEINTAIKVMYHINFKSAYGHSSIICSASARMLRLLDDHAQILENSSLPFLTEDEEHK